MALSGWLLGKLGELGIRVAEGKIRKLFKEKQVEVDKFDGLQLNVKGKHNSVTVNIIASPEAIAQSGKLVDRKGNEIVLLAREDIAFYEAEDLSPHEQWLGIVREMRGYVTDRHLAALKAAVTICRLEDLGNSAEANIRKEQFDRHFKNDGKQIYNMIRSRIFHEWILPVFLERKYIEQNLKRSQEIFQEFFAMCVQYLPWAIFVGKHKDEYDLRQAIMSRALDERVKMVAVFTRGPRLALMAERACEDVRKSLTAAGLTASIEAKDYKIGDSPARVYLLEFSR